MNRLAIIAAAVLALTATEAHADPCQAIPDKGPAPSWIKPGAEFTGQVRYVGDGDSLCVGSSPDPRTWVEVRLEDFYAPELSEPGGREAKAAMSRIAMGRTVRCVVTRRGRVRSWDRVVATCRLNGRGLREHMKSAGVAEGGRGRQ
jgi:micrococcal nuclease